MRSSGTCNSSPLSYNGLSRSEQAILEVIEEGTSVLKDVYRASHHQREEWAFLADTVFALYVERLSGGYPLVASATGQRISATDVKPGGRLWEQSVKLTPQGHAVLNAEEDFVRLNGIDRWLGGVHLSKGTIWRWDSEEHCLRKD